MEKARVAVPTPVQKPQPHAFPVLATLAPVGMSVVIWLATKSPFVLMFAGLGPAVAVASIADARRQDRRRLRSERARFAHELRSAREETRTLHDWERRELDLDAPSAAARLERGDHDPERWAAGIGSASVTVGRGIRRSAIELELPSGRSDEAQALADLAALATTLDDAPVTVPAALGIAVVGPPALAGSVARGIIAQLAAVLPPNRAVLSVGSMPAAEHWFHALPHRLVVDDGLRDGEVAFRIDGERAAVAVGATIDDVPSHVRVVLRAGADARIERHPDRSRCTSLSLEYVSREQARGWADRLTALAGPMTPTGPPDAVPLASLLVAATAAPGSLSAPVGVDAAGPCVIDLVEHGPHAIIGGTTGSGKSELLIAWVLSLAHRYPPTDVTFLLVDFKGGSSFAPLEQLPHCVGVISDLDAHSAIRALESLRAELRWRERMLADAGVRSIDELPGTLPRLVIVVDEFAAMVADFPELHALFADLAARGRSLGLHLVLCTQRPSGVVRDAVFANAGLRISLRVNNRVDSQAVIGADAAAEFPAQARGRALVSFAGEPPRELQVALASPQDSVAVAGRWPGAPRPRRPWRDPLPTVVRPDELERVGGSTFGVPFGIADWPERQAQPTVSWHPDSDGHLLVVGAARSGKTTTLAALASGERARIVPTDPEQAWDAVAEVLRDIRTGVGHAVLALDDLDAVLARYSDEHAGGFLDALAAVLREGPACGVYLVLATQRITPGLHSIVSLCDRRLLLRMPTKQDHLIAGGAGESYDAAAPPGRATWNGHIVQVALVPSPDALEPPGPRRVGPPLAVVSGSPHAFAERARSLGACVGELGGANPADVIVGDPEAWQSRWGALQTANATMPVFFDGCSLADFRLLARSRVLPPPVVTSVGAGWLMTMEGTVERATFG
ncbi:hypothetical protein BH11ACT2_BH11ACT2_11720 [soil metagenome]